MCAQAEAGLSHGGRGVVWLCWLVYVWGAGNWARVILGFGHQIFLPSRSSTSVLVEFVRVLQIIVCFTVLLRNPSMRTCHSVSELQCCSATKKTAALTKKSTAPT